MAALPESKLSREWTSELKQLFIDISTDIYSALDKKPVRRIPSSTWGLCIAFSILAFSNWWQYAHVKGELERMKHHLQDVETKCLSGVEIANLGIKRFTDASNVRHGGASYASMDELGTSQAIGAGHNATMPKPEGANLDMLDLARQDFMNLDSANAYSNFSTGVLLQSPDIHADMRYAYDKCIRLERNIAGRLIISGNDKSTVKDLVSKQNSHALVQQCRNFVMTEQISQLLARISEIPNLPNLSHTPDPHENAGHLSASLTLAHRLHDELASRVNALQHHVSNTGKFNFDDVKPQIANLSGLLTLAHRRSHRLVSRVNALEAFVGNITAMTNFEDAGRNLRAPSVLTYRNIDELASGVEAREENLDHVTAKLRLEDQEQTIRSPYQHDDELASRVAALEERVDNMTKNRQFENVEQHDDELANRVDGLEAHVDSITAKLYSEDQAQPIRSLYQHSDELASRVAALEERVSNITAKSFFENLEQASGSLYQYDNELASRVAALEERAGNITVKSCFETMEQPSGSLYQHDNELGDRVNALEEHVDNSTEKWHFENLGRSNISFYQHDDALGNEEHASNNTPKSHLGNLGQPSRTLHQHDDEVVALEEHTSNISATSHFEEMIEHIRNLYQHDDALASRVNALEEQKKLDVEDMRHGSVNQATNHAKGDTAKVGEDMEIEGGEVPVTIPSSLGVLAMKKQIAALEGNFTHLREQLANFGDTLHLETNDRKHNATMLAHACRKQHGNQSSKPPSLDEEVGLSLNQCNSRIIDLEKRFANETHHSRVLETRMYNSAEISNKDDGTNISSWVSCETCVTKRQLAKVQQQMVKQERLTELEHEWTSLRDQWKVFESRCKVVLWVVAGAATFAILKDLLKELWAAIFIS